MRFYFLTIFCVIFLSGCSIISSCEYLDICDENAVAVSRDDWMVDTSEPSFGFLRPPLKQITLNDISVIVYPIMIEEKAVSFGPALFPIIPVFEGIQDPESIYKNKIRLLYNGEKKKVENLELIVNGKKESMQLIVDSPNKIWIVSDVVKTKDNKMEVTIIFNEKSSSLHFIKMKTYCFVPFASFND